MNKFFVLIPREGYYAGIVPLTNTEKGSYGTLRLFASRDQAKRVGCKHAMQTGRTTCIVMSLDDACEAVSPSLLFEPVEMNTVFERMVEPFQ